MLRLGIAVLLMFALVGCASTRVAAQDFQARTFRICGNRYAQMSDLNTAASIYLRDMQNVKDWCPAARTVRCADERYGSTSSVYVGGYGNHAYGVGESTDLIGNCCEYQCTTAPAAAPTTAAAGATPTAPAQ
jgi:hypothetical protein